MAITVRDLFFEKLDWIVGVELLEDQVYRAKVVAQVDPTFPALLRMACIANERITGLPEGIPEDMKPETDLPVGMAETTIRQEIRRIKNFQPKGSLQNVHRNVRENQWLQILEGIHWKEAVILTHIKDWTLFEVYPALFDIMEQLGAVLDIQRPTTPAPKAPEESLVDGTANVPEIPSDPTQNPPSEPLATATTPRARKPRKKKDAGESSGEA